MHADPERRSGGQVIGGVDVAPQIRIVAVCRVQFDGPGTSMCGRGIDAERGRHRALADRADEQCCSIATAVGDEGGTMRGGRS